MYICVLNPLYELGMYVKKNISSLGGLLLLLSLTILTLGSCSSDTDKFSIEGRFMNFNRGELYVYSIDGGLNALDTITVQDGRFRFETMLSVPATFVIVFPNFTEVPIFGEPGKSVNIKADASNLREMEIKGSKDNKMMNGLRRELVMTAPPEVTKKVAAFVEENPASIVCHYAVSKYILRAPNPNYKEAVRLLTLISKERPTDKYVKILKNQTEVLAACPAGEHLPEFFLRARSGKTIKKDFCKGKIGIITVGASWDYESARTQQRLISLQEKYKDKIAVLGISLDVSKKQVDDFVKNNNIPWQVCWDGLVWESPMLRTLGLSNVDDNIIIGWHGTIAYRNLSADNMEEQVTKMVNN